MTIPMVSLTAMPKTTPSVTELPPPQILIVDDDPDIALVLHDLLEHVGYRVSVAGTGGELSDAQQGEHRTGQPA